VSVGWSPHAIPIKVFMTLLSLRLLTSTREHVFSPGGWLKQTEQHWIFGVFGERIMGIQPTQSEP
jgi:hypothetical protein